MPVDIDLLSERMNLNIIYSLLPDGILGQTFFKKTENYDKGTVLVNIDSPIKLFQKKIRDKANFRQEYYNDFGKVSLEHQ